MSKPGKKKKRDDWFVRELQSVLSIASKNKLKMNCVELIKNNVGASFFIVPKIQQHMALIFN